MKWYERPDVLSYIIDSYAGTEPCDKGPAMRQFLWEDVTTGDTLLGNTAAFAEHVRTKFDLGATESTVLYGVHDALHALGEVVREVKHTGERKRQRHVRQKPAVRVVRRRER